MQHDREFIITELSNLECTKSISAVRDYVDFCFMHDVGEKVKSRTSAHHVLPRAKTLPFVEFANLKKHSWNKVELEYYDHYIAHYLLTKAIDHIAAYHAFCAMHNKDVARNLLPSIQLISPNEYEELYQLRNQAISKRSLELVEVDGRMITRAKQRNDKIDRSAQRVANSARFSGANNPVYRPGVVDKILETKRRLIDGVSVSKLGSDKAAATMSIEYVDDNGNPTTIYKETGKKVSKTLTAPLIVGNTVTTLAAVRGVRRSKTMREQGEWYVLKNVYDPTIHQVISAVELRKISGNLYIKTKEDYLGKTLYGRNVFTNRGKAHLIGLYVEKHESTLGLDIPDPICTQEQ